MLHSRPNLEDHPGSITNRSLICDSKGVQDTNISSSQIKGKFTINENLKEGIDFVVFPDIVAYLLFNTYGVDLILKSRRKHVFQDCQNENCKVCYDNWNNKCKFSLVSMCKDMKDRLNFYEDELKKKNQKTTNKQNSYTWGFSQDTSEKQVSRTKKRGCLSFFQC